MTKEEIHKLVDKHTFWYDSIGRQIIDENGTDDLKDELVKLFSMPVVVLQSEQLCENPNCEDGIVDKDYYGKPIFCHVCDKYN